tara:strand:+ start:18895 stop:19479 length:585 start_codon:yes stop_codon:yes gene_type:complete
MIISYKSQKQRGFIAWIITSLMIFIIALVIEKFSILGSNLGVENQKNQLFYWTNLIFERAETRLYKSYLNANDIANWKLTKANLVLNNQCLSFSDIYQQKDLNQFLNSEDFYPPQVNHWNRIDESLKKQITSQYKNFCYKVSLELVSKLDHNLNETHDPDLLLLIVNVIDQASNYEYVKRGFISKYKLVDNYEI